MKYFVLTIGCCILCFNANAQATRQAVADSIIAQIQKKIAPDKRVAVFDIKTQIEGKLLIIKGFTDQIEVKPAIRQVLQTAGITAKDNIALLPDPALGVFHFGLVNVSVANIRSEPKHSAELATQALLGTPLRVLRRQGDWYQVQTPDRYIGWLENGGFISKDSTEMTAWRNSERLIYMGDFALCFAGPGETIPVSDLVTGAIIEWDTEAGRLRFPDGRLALLPEGEWLRLSEWGKRTASHQDSIFRTAFRFCGRPYLWGGTSGKGLDCSGFTKTVYFLHGAIIPRDASQQVFAGEEVPIDDALTALFPGDFLFFGNYRDDGSRRITHVGIYTGEGRFIHSGSDNGFIRAQSLRPADPDFAAHRLQSLLQVRRMHVGGPGVSSVRNSGWYF